MLWTVNLWKLSRILVGMSNLRLLWLIWLEGEMAVISSQLFGVVKSGEILIILTVFIYECWSMLLCPPLVLPAFRERSFCWHHSCHCSCVFYHLAVSDQHNDVVSSAECIKGSLVWEVTQSYVKRAYGIGFNTYAWGNPHAHSCSLMLNWFQTLIWEYVMDPLIQFRVVWGWVRPGQRASLSQSSQRDLFIHARSDSHMAKFRLSSKPNIYIFGLWGQPRCPERPHTDQTGPGRPRDLNPGPVLL